MTGMAEFGVQVGIGLGGLDHFRVDVDQLSMPGAQFQGEAVETLTQLHGRSPAHPGGNRPAQADQDHGEDQVRLYRQGPPWGRGQGAQTDPGVWPTGVEFYLISS